MNQQINTIREALAHIEGMEKRPGVSTGAVQFHATTAANLLRAALTELEAAMREPVAWMHWLHGPVRLFMNKDEAMMELERLNREYPVDVGARQMRPLFAAPPAQQADGPQAATIEDAARDVGKWLNERPNRPLDLRSVAMLAAHAQQAQTGAVPQGYVLVPVDVLKAASESLGNFVSDHGWTDADMQAMDNLDAAIVQQKGWAVAAGVSGIEAGLWVRNNFG